MDKVKKVFSAIFYCFTKINKNNWVYKLVALFGLILRVCFLPILIPDVFEVVANLIIGQFNLPVLVYELIVRLILLVVDLLALSAIFHYVTFACVGCFYEKAQEPVFGSISYTIFYCIHTFMPVFLIKYFTWVAIILAFLVYAIISAIFYIIASKLDAISKSWVVSLIIHSIIYAVLLTIVILLKVYVF